jgi:hypothetical protein
MDGRASVCARAPRWLTALGVGFLLVTPLHAAPPPGMPPPGGVPPTHEEVEDAEVVVANCEHYPAPAIRRACLTLARVRECKSTQSLTNVVEDDTLDAGTRAMAALAIGAIACKGNGQFGLIPPVVRVLEAATARHEPLLLRQAAARALGRARAEGAVKTLEAIWSDSPDNPVLRVICAQSLTTITGDVYLTADFMAEVQQDLQESTSFRMLTVAP